MKHPILSLILLLGIVPAMASAEDLRDLCADRPGKGTPPCILDKGHIQYEAAFADWTRDSSGGAREDTILAADSLLRLGVTDDTEVQIGWTPIGFVRTRALGGAVSHESGTGDVTLALRHSLQNPDGSDFSIAVQPFVTLPVGGHAIGDNSWSTGLILPASIELPGDLQLAVVPEVDAAANADSKGRHLAYSIATGLTAPIGKSGVDASGEFWAQRDNDPSGHATQMSLDFSAAWQPKALANLQLDIGTNIGVNHNTPGLELYSGVAWRF